MYCIGDFGQNQIFPLPNLNIRYRLRFASKPLGLHEVLSCGVDRGSVDENMWIGPLHCHAVVSRSCDRRREAICDVIRLQTSLGYGA